MENTIKNNINLVVQTILEKYKSNKVLHSKHKTINVYIKLKPDKKLHKTLKFSIIKSKLPIELNKNKILFWGTRQEYEIIKDNNIIWGNELINNKKKIKKDYKFCYYIGNSVDENSHIKKQKSNLIRKNILAKNQDNFDNNELLKIIQSKKVMKVYENKNSLSCKIGTVNDNLEDLCDNVISIIQIIPKNNLLQIYMNRTMCESHICNLK